MLREQIHGHIVDGACISFISHITDWLRLTRSHTIFDFVLYAHFVSKSFLL